MVIITINRKWLTQLDYMCVLNNMLNKLIAIQY